MIPIIGETAEMIFVAMGEKVAVACLVLLAVLKVIHSDVRVCYVTHFIVMIGVFSLPFTDLNLVYTDR